jgi:hypothetical protein
VHPIGISKEQVIAALKDAPDELGEKLTYKSYTAWATENRRPSIAPLVRHSVRSTTPGRPQPSPSTMRLAPPRCLSAPRDSGR